MLAALLLAFLSGSGLSENELDNEQREMIDEEIALFLASLEVIIARLESGIDMLPTVDRLANQVMRVFFLGVLAGEDAGARLTWVRDPEKDSCNDCITQDGNTRTVEEWRVLAEQGIFPRSLGLECTGRFCGCRFV